MSQAKNPGLAVLKQANGAEKIGYGNQTVKQALEQRFFTAEMVSATGDGLANDSAPINDLLDLQQATGVQVYLEKLYSVDDATKTRILDFDQSKLKGVGAIVDTAGNRIPIGNDYKARALGEKRPVPEAIAFAWLDILPTVHGVGNVDASESATGYGKRVHSGLIGGGVVYVDPVNGNDANTGSMAAPVKTISEAARIKAPSQIYLLGSGDQANPAVFRKFDFRDTDTPGNKLKIVTAKGHCVIEEEGDELATLNWTSIVGTPNVYESPALTGTAPPRALFWNRYQDTNGGPLRIPNYTSVAAVNASGFGWHFDGSKLNVRIQGLNIDTIKAELDIVYGDAASRCLFLGTKIVLEAERGGSLLFKGVNLVPLVSGATRAELFTGPGVKIHYAPGHGLDALGALTVLEEIDVYAAKLDNLHYTDSGGISCQAIEINCVSHEAGDKITYGAQAAGTDNGSAMHGSGHVARYGGRYFNNNGPDVVDSGSGHYWNVGTEAYDSGLAANAYGFDVTGGTMWLDTCHARDEALADLRVEAGATMRLFNTHYRTLTVADATSRVTDFDPMKPY